MKSGIYVIRNTINEKCYVGSAKDFTTRKKKHFFDLRKNIHCNIKLQRSFNKHGETAFVFEIIELLPYEKDTIIAAENNWMVKLNSKASGYNIADASFGDILTNHPNREGIIAKITKTVNANMSAMSAEERKVKWGLPGERNPIYGQKRPEYVIDAMRQGTKKFVEINGHGPTKGYKMSEETKKLLSDIAKTRIGDKNSFYGREHTEETKAKISAKNKGKKCLGRLSLFIDGIWYDSIKDAEVATGIKGCTIWFRLQSKNPKFATYIIDKDKSKILPLTKF